MSFLRLPLLGQMSTNPQVDRDGVGWASTVVDSLHKLLNGNIDATNIADGSITSAKILDGTIVNADISASAAIDASKVSGGAWTTYTATWSGSSAPFSGGLGNGTLDGRYFQFGKFVVCHIALVWGSTSSSPGGTWQFALPVTKGGLNAFGTGKAIDSSAGQAFGLVPETFTTTVLRVLSPTSPLAGVTNIAPFTWATSDSLELNLVYEAA